MCLKKSLRVGTLSLWKELYAYLVMICARVESPLTFRYWQNLESSKKAKKVKF